MDLLIKLLKLKPEELKIFLYKYLKEKGMPTISEEGYVYAEGDIPILLVAHMDTVFDEPPKIVEYSKKYDILYNPFGGLGGDDRCGVYAILKLLEKYRPHILFTEDEEIGGIGAMYATCSLPKPDVKYIIEFDRRGKKDCVFYDCGNQNFMDYVEAFGFETDYGTFTDISILGEEWDIAAVNLSSGYYNEHTEEEFIIFSELRKTIKRVEAMIDNLEYALYFDHQTIKYKRPYFVQGAEDDYDDYLIDYYDSSYDIVYDTSVQPSQEQPLTIASNQLRIEDKEGPRLLLEMKNNRPSKNEERGKISCDKY